MLAVLLGSFLWLPSWAQSSGPVAAYSFDGSGSTLQDVSGNNNTMTLVNGPTWGTGKYGSALVFDGSNDRAVANAYNPALNLTDNRLTLSAWVNPRTNSGWQLIVDKPATNGHRPPYFDWSMHRENGSGRLNAYFGCEMIQRSSNSAIPLNTWTHVAITLDGEYLRHYINGVLDRTTRINCTIRNNSSRPIRIGANGAGGEVMNGSIDDVRIYNRVLTAAEIQNDMSTRLPSMPDGNTPPVASITAPANGASVAGTLSITANASDDVGVTGVQFKIDGQNFGAEDTFAPYSIQWNTTQWSNGSHTLGATARDAAGGVANASNITVNVSNAAGAPVPTLSSFSASPTQLASGGTSTLTWNSSNATACVASGGWSGNKPTSGSQSTPTLTNTTTFTLGCSSGGGTTSGTSVSKSVTVNVASNAPAPTVSLNANPTSVASGSSATLTWSSANANSCSASGAWSGTKATSGTASTGALASPDKTFSLTCTGAGGSASASTVVQVTTQGSGGGAQTGLNFPGSAATTGTIRFRFTNPLAIYPATYIWRYLPRQQNGYYTTFFWGNDGPFYWNAGSPDSYYGAHPYPSPPPNGTPKWEISVDGGDILSPEPIAFGRWHTQALRVWSDGSGKHHEFYYDLPDTSKVIRVTVRSSYGNAMPPNAALTLGDAPWNPSNEIMNGVLRGIQVYSGLLGISEVLAEAQSPLSTATGASRIWYMNLNPTPTDISDKSGAGHNPTWVGSGRPQLWTGP